MEKNLIFWYILLILIEVVLYASYLIYSHYKEKRDEERLEQLERLQSYNHPLITQQHPLMMGYQAIDPQTGERYGFKHPSQSVTKQIVPISLPTTLPVQVKPKDKFDSIAEKLDKLIELQQQQQKSKDSPILSDAPVAPVAPTEAN